jgi:acyl-CoA synthetase (NDP forming)
VLRALTAAGLAGPVYPINPNAEALDGVRYYPSLAAAPRGVDECAAADAPAR